jgi:hypothetical protein
MESRVSFNPTNFMKKKKSAPTDKFSCSQLVIVQFVEPVPFDSLYNNLCGCLQKEDLSQNKAPEKKKRQAKKTVAGQKKNTVITRTTYKKTVREGY